MRAQLLTEKRGIGIVFNVAMFILNSIFVLIPILFALRLSIAMSEYTGCMKWTRFCYLFVFGRRAGNVDDCDNDDDSNRTEKKDKIVMKQCNLKIQSGKNPKAKKKKNEKKREESAHGKYNAKQLQKVHCAIYIQFL